MAKNRIATIELWEEEQKSKAPDFMAECLREALKPKHTIKSVCIWLTKGDKDLTAARKLLENDTDELTTTRALWDAFAPAYGYNTRWRDSDDPTIDKWKGNKKIGFKAYNGEMIEYYPKAKREPLTPDPSDIVCFLWYLTLDTHEFADVNIIKCKKCNAITVEAEYCRYCGKQLTPHIVNVTNWDLIGYYDYFDKQLNK